MIHGIPFSYITGHVCCFPFFSQTLPKEDTGLTDSLVFKRTRCWSCLQENLPYPEISSPLVSVFRFSCTDGNLAKPKDKEMLACLIHKGRSNMVMPFLPHNPHMPNDAMMMHSRLPTCLCWWSAFPSVITVTFLKKEWIIEVAYTTVHCRRTQLWTLMKNLVPISPIKQGGLRQFCPPRDKRGSTLIQDPGRNCRAHSWPSDSLAPVRMDVIEKTRDNKCQRGCEDKGSFQYGWWAWNWVQPLWKAVSRVLKKLKTTAVCSRNSTPEYLLEEKANTDLKRYMHTSAHCSTIHKSRDTETTRLLMDEYIKKPWFIHTMKPQREGSSHLRQHGWILRAWC